MIRPLRRVVVAFACLAPPALGHAGLAAQTLTAAVRERLRAVPSPTPGVRRFYEARGFQPAWIGDAGPLPQALELRDITAAADVDGLDPAAYELPPLHPPLDPGSLAAFDLALTRVALAYLSDLEAGRVAPASVDSLWSGASDRSDPAGPLAAALAAWRLRALPGAFAPPQPGYARLRAGLARYRAIAALGGWDRLAPGAAPVPGDTGLGVRALEARLVLEGDLDPRDAGGRYDSALDAGVRRFQRRHGLDADGEIGPLTRAALDVPVERRIRQIELNLERWRWLPRSLGERYLMVNAADFQLVVVDRDSVALEMRTIVGRPDWPTPIVSARGTDLVFSPWWNIPRRIAVEEILPIARRDTGYLRREGIRVFDSTETAEIDPATVDWRAVSDSSFAFQLRQSPGGTNPLGGVKLLFPNRFDAYIHDTPGRALFRERPRTFSHGCIRAERAADLVAYLLGDDPRWPRDSIQAAMTSGHERWVPLRESIPVHVGYWTAWADPGGAVEFRDDVYGWDERLATALYVTEPHGPFTSPSPRAPHVSAVAPNGSN